MTRLSRLPPWLAVAAAGALFLAVRTASAAGCCGSNLAQADRLGADESWSFVGALRGHTTFGGWDLHGTFLRDRADSHDLEGRLQLGASARLSRTWQASLGGAWVETYRSFGARSSLAGAPADLSAGVRVDPESLSRWAFTGQLTMPLGRTVFESTDAFGADVTGRGAFTARVGGAFEQPFEDLFVVVSGGLTVSGPERGNDVRAGAALDAMVLAGRSFLSGAGVSAGVRGYVHAGYWRPSGRTAPWHLLTLLVSGAVPVGRTLSVVGTASLEPPLSGFGSNDFARLALSAGVRAVR